MKEWTDYQVPVKYVTTDGEGTERPVRGLSIDDISELVVNHLDTMMEITTLYIQSQRDILAGTNMTDMTIIVAKQFPKFLSEVISMVTDAPQLRETRLPVGLQVQIISAALTLTVEDAGGLGNLSAILQNVVKTAVAERGEVSRKLQDILSPSSTSGAAKTRTS